MGRVEKGDVEVEEREKRHERTTKKKVKEQQERHQPPTAYLFERPYLFSRKVQREGVRLAVN